MPSILVVEPEESYAERIRGALAAEGWRVRVVPRADQAIQAAASEAPDLVMVSAEVPGAQTLAGAFSRHGGGPGVVGLVEEGVGFPGGALGADDLLAKPFSDDDLRSATRRALAGRRPAPPPPPPVSAGEHRLTSQDIFGDVLAEVEGGGQEGAPPPPAAAPRPPAATPKPSRDDDEMQRRLEKTLSGMLGAEHRPRPAPPPAAAPAPPPRRPEPAADKVDALLSQTLSKLEMDFGRTKTGVRPPPPAAAPAPPPPAPPQAAAAPPARPPAPPPLAPPQTAPAGEGTAVRKARIVGDFDFTELEELARTGRPAAAAPPRPAAPPAAVPPAAAVPRPEPPRPAPPAPAPEPEPPPFMLPPELPMPPPPEPFAAANAAATQRIPVFLDDTSGEPPGERFGQYRLLEKIAAGGMAEVWKARMRGVEGFQKTVAIKKILPHMTDNNEFVGMFIDEAKLAAQLSHPNIVHIYDLGKLGRDYYIAMEYVEGKDLRSLLNTGRRKRIPLPMGLALMIAARVASALDYAHRKRDFEDREMGLVHRDVSPQNVLLSYEGDVKLCDFGIVKAVAKANQTQMGSLKGKLQYMSPEQAWGRPVDARSDIFSLGSVLFEMLTGERLFGGDSEMSVLESVRQGKVRSPRQLEPALPREVDEIVLRALAPDPPERFQTAGEMKQRLEAVLTTLSPQPGPTDLASYLHRVLVAPEPDFTAEGLPEPVKPSSWLAELAEAAPAPVAAPVSAAAEEPVEALAPFGEVRVEEGGRKSRTLLYVAIAALVIVALLTFYFLSRRSSAPPEPVPAPSPGATVQAPPMPVDVPEASPPAGVDVDATVEKLLAEREEARRRQNEEKLKALETQLAAAWAAQAANAGAGQPTPAPSAAPVPTPAAVAPAQEAAPPPAPEPESQREPEPVKAEEKPPAPEPRREPEPAPAPRAQPGDLVEPGAGVVPPQLVSFPKPEYPPMARTLRVEGIVVVAVLVDENGQVQDSRVTEPIKQKVGLNEAAVAAARSARYKPATKDGVRVKMWTRLRIPFKL